MELPDRILVVAPHADDEVIGCGGLLHRAARDGAETTVVVVATDDEERTVELKEACRVLGVANVEVLFGPMPFIDDLDDSRIVSAIDDALARHAPRLVLVPSQAGYHQEHRRVAGLAVSATRPGGGRTFGHAPQSVWYYEAPADVSSPTGAWSPTLYVTLDDVDVAAKCDAMLAHASQVRPYPSERSTEALRSLAVLRGCQVGAAFAEAYAPRRQVF
ncbi:PIG-L deacetylase family protein [Desertimonas flava]|uniref:PIG-L deacetylase family protein n=1 Tax=Desertimonas flava TaxID=2064846 RepID=UPI0013C4E774|nr:PIG-L deacetylase family protein [Desertimonas flava]